MNGNVEQVKTPGAEAPPYGTGTYRAELRLAAIDRGMGRYVRAQEYEAAAEDTRKVFGLEPEPVCIPALADCRFDATEAATLRALVTRALVRIGDDAAFTTDELVVCTAIFGRQWLAAPRSRVAVAVVEGHLRAWARTAGAMRGEGVRSKPGRVTKAVRRRAGRVYGRVLKHVRRYFRRASVKWYTWVALMPGARAALPRAMAGASWSTRAWCFGFGLGLPFTPRADASAFELVADFASIQGRSELVPQWAVLLVSNWVKSFGPRDEGVYQSLMAAAGVQG